MHATRSEAAPLVHPRERRGVEHRRRRLREGRRPVVEGDLLVLHHARPRRCEVARPEHEALGRRLVARYKIIEFPPRSNEVVAVPIFGQREAEAPLYERVDQAMFEGESVDLIFQSVVVERADAPQGLEMKRVGVGEKAPRPAN